MPKRDLLRLFRRRKKSAVARFGVERVCQSCGRDFVLSNLEMTYYRLEGQVSPHVCRICQKRVLPGAFETDAPGSHALFDHRKRA